MYIARQLYTVCVSSFIYFFIALFNFFASTFPNPTTFSPTPMLMTLLFPVTTLISWLKPLLPMHVIKYWGVDRWATFDHFWSKILYHSLHPSICAILTPILKLFWTAPYYPWKGFPIYWESPSILTSNSMPMSNL